MCLHPHLQSLAHLLTVTTSAIHYRVTADISTVNLFLRLQAIIYGATLLIYHCDLQCSPSLNSRYPHNKMSKCWYNQLGDLLSQWTLIYVSGQLWTIWAWNMTLILVQERSDWLETINHRSRIGNVGDGVVWVYCTVTCVMFTPPHPHTAIVPVAMTNEVFTPDVSWGSSFAS